MGRIAKENVEFLCEVLKGKKITILGHDNIDVDSFLSGLLLSKLFTFIGIENEFCILDEVRESDTKVIINELFGIDVKSYQKNEEVSKRNLFLVDHYETIHQGKVIGIIDHHPNQKNLEYEFCYERNSSATAYMIYEIMKIVGYPLTKDVAEKIIVATLIDTVSFKSSKTVNWEAQEMKVLAKEYDIDFESLSKYCLCLTDISKMSDEEIISNGEKWYSYKRKNDVASSYLQLYEFPSKDILDHWLNLLKEKILKTDAEMMVFIIYDMKNERTYEYHVTLKRQRITVYAGILSRGKDIMPKVEMKVKYS